MGITLEEIDLNASLPINPTIIRIMRVLRITRGRHAAMHKHNNTEDIWLTLAFCNVSVLKLLKMATGMRALLDTVIQALPQVRGGSEAVKDATTAIYSPLRQDHKTLTTYHRSSAPLLA